MEVFHTEGDPPSIGSTSLVTMGWTVKTSAAEVKIAAANSTRVCDPRRLAGAGERAASVMRLVRPDRPG